MKCCKNIICYKSDAHIIKLNLVKTYAVGDTKMKTDIINQLPVCKTFRNLASLPTEEIDGYNRRSSCETKCVEMDNYGHHHQTITRRRIVRTLNLANERNMNLCAHQPWSVMTRTVIHSAMETGNFSWHRIKFTVCTLAILGGVPTLEKILG